MEHDMTGYGLRAFWHEQAAWSRATFGADDVRGPTGPLKHLAKEVAEAIEETDIKSQRMEIVDCQFLVFDAARRSGLTFDEFVTMCWSKLAINKSRQWQTPTSDEPVEHVR